MGCSKSAPSVSSPKILKQNQQDASRPSHQEQSKIIFSNAVTFKKQKDNNGEKKNNLDNESEISERSTKRNRRKQGQADQVYLSKSPEQIKAHDEIIIEHHELVNEHDENAFKEKIILKDKQQQPVFVEKEIESQNQNDYLNSYSILNELQKDDLRNNEHLLKETIETQLYINAKEEYEHSEQQKPNDELDEKDAQKINESDGSSNICNVLRQQTTSTQVFTSLRSSGSINRQTSGQRIQNSNIITSGLDYENKRRQLIRKMSDEIEELEEIDENTYQIGATKQTVSIHGEGNLGKRAESIIQSPTFNQQHNNQDDTIVPLKEQNEQEEEDF